MCVRQCAENAVFPLMATYYPKSTAKAATSRRAGPSQHRRHDDQSLQLHQPQDQQESSLLHITEVVQQAMQEQVVQQAM